MNTEEYGRMHAVEDGHWWYRALHALVVHHVRRFLPATATVIDVGCGTGGVAVRLPDTYQTIGLDRAPEAIAYCRERGLTGTALADAQALPVGDGTADGVLLMDVIYHQGVERPALVLEEAFRVLRPGGHVLVNVPAYQWLYSTHDMAVHTARRFTRGELDEMLVGAGFEVVQSSYWNTILFPIIVACRLLFRLFPREGSDLDVESPVWVNRVLGAIMALERAWLQWAPLPFGLSVFAVARVPEPLPIDG